VDLLERGFAIDAELVLEVKIARAEEDVDAPLFGVLEAAGARFDVRVRASRERGDGRRPHLARDVLHAGEILGARRGKPCFDDVHAERLELLRELKLLLGGHPVTGRLFAIS
jgi:hypothetical protein